MQPLPEPRRLAYLEAMGIPVWRQRGVAAQVETAETGSATQVSSPEPGSAVATPSSEPAASVRAEPPADAEPAGDGVAAMDRDELEATIRACTACALCETRTQAVPGVGNAGADLLIIGEAPGQEEDRRGEPFVGRAGQLLDRMLAAIGLDRDTVYITNVLKCRPPKNRDPKPEEVQACSGYLRRQIELIRPRAILAVGRISAQQLLETGEPIGRLRGRWHRFGPRDTPLLVTYHPAYLLRSPGEKRKAWTDLKAVRDHLRVPMGGD
ncbi:MAG: uracil-DNA glycosylase [Halofilum sp. (in: g-proteobacteria)]|nr:uracil-DNA glycosylase [Halofilum sp. (in: g-proteobacteria)]